MKPGLVLLFGILISDLGMMIFGFTLGKRLGQQLGREQGRASNKTRRELLRLYRELPCIDRVLLVEEQQAAERNLDNTDALKFYVGESFRKLRRNRAPEAPN